MKKILILLVALISVSCVDTKHPYNRCLQVDYVEEGEAKHLFLNVIEEKESHYRVLSQEYIDEETPFVIVRIFDYNN